jgi:hypothetical protein
MWNIHIKGSLADYWGIEYAGIVLLGYMEFAVDYIKSTQSILKTF